MHALDLHPSYADHCYHTHTMPLHMVLVSQLDQSGLQCCQRAQLGTLHACVLGALLGYLPLRCHAYRVPDTVSAIA
jgi:hypothetical protein